jgi:hypothetical protein
LSLFFSWETTWTEDNPGQCGPPVQGLGILGQKQLLRRFLNGVLRMVAEAKQKNRRLPAPGGAECEECCKIRRTMRGATQKINRPLKTSLGYLYGALPNVPQRRHSPCGFGSAVQQRLCLITYRARCTREVFRSLEPGEPLSASFFASFVFHILSKATSTFHLYFLERERKAALRTWPSFLAQGSLDRTHWPKSFLWRSYL